MSNGFKNIEDIVKNKPLILFDGVCNLCNSAVQFVIKNDIEDRYMFAPLQNKKVQDFLEYTNKELLKVDSIFLITSKKIYTKSSAALKIAKTLQGLYPILYVFFIIPKPIRDVIYDFIARNRYKWYGRKDHCMLPTKALKNKFLED